MRKHDAVMCDGYVTRKSRYHGHSRTLWSWCYRSCLCPKGPSTRWWTALMCRSLLLLSVKDFILRLLQSMYSAMLLVMQLVLMMTFSPYVALISAHEKRLLCWVDTGEILLQLCFGDSPVEVLINLVKLLPQQTHPFITQLTSTRSTKLPRERNETHICRLFL